MNVRRRKIECELRGVWGGVGRVSDAPLGFHRFQRVR